MAHTATPLKRLSVIAGQSDLSNLHLPTITDNAEDVVGMQGRIRLQKNDQITTSSQWMDKQRNTLLAYEYLCHIGEAKEWIESCLQEEIDPIIKLEESMRDGVVLAKLAAKFAPGTVQKIVIDTKRKFRQSENINSFFNALVIVRLPNIFWFELTDLYDKKNIPKVIYCIHALSHLLANRRVAPNIKNLYGKLHFTNEELRATQKVLDSYNVAMPNFKNVEHSLRNKLSEEFEDNTYQFQQIDLPDITEGLPAPTPELIVEEDSDSDEDEERYRRVYSPIRNTKTEDDGINNWSDPVVLEKVKMCQSAVRAWLARKELRHAQTMHRSTFFQSRVTHIQAQIRGVLCRRALESKHITLENSEEWIEKFQSACRGYLQRNRYQQAMAHYESNIDKIVKLQGFVKNKLLKNSLRRLTTNNNPSVGTVKSFIHLLDDSNLDFDRELMLENLRQQVINHIRENNQLDAHVNSVDIQIALLLRNAISLDEVLKTTGAFQKKKEQQRRFSQLASPGKSLRGVDKENRHRLELYQQLVYLLQTEPKYLARLMSLTSGQNLGEHTGGHKRIESTVLSLFGYATNSREEYLLINLCKYCIAEEMKFVGNTQEFMRGNYTFMKLVVQSNRGAKEREFFRKVLAPIISEVVNNEFLDLETDPVGIYHKAVNDEESRTGRPSARKHSVNSQEALADPEVRDKFILHLRNLREFTERFLTTITSAMDEVPYGIRVVARELRLVLEENFPDERPENIIKILGHFIYYRYLNPAIVAPEQYDVMDSFVDPVQRKNLAEISKMLQQISAGKIFDDNDMFLAPLNDYVEDAGKRFGRWFMQLTDVQPPEAYFGMDMLADHARTQKPVVYISPYELYYLHYMLGKNLDELEPSRGTLRDILHDLGQSPYNPGSDVPSDSSVLCLALTNRCNDIPQDPTARLQQLLVDTKRLVVYVIRIQSGTTLQDIFEATVTQEHEQAWSNVKLEEFEDTARLSTQRRYLKLGRTAEEPLDLKSIRFDQLKTITHHLLAHLERCRVISDVQDVINMIAHDITSKNSRREQRDREIAKLQQTLTHLKNKQQYLLDQRQQYEDYLSGCMDRMAGKKKKQRVFPFTRQYFHIRGLQKQGLVPKYGSYKYTAKQLHERGIVVDIADIHPKHYDRIPIILSMDQAGVIAIEGSYAGWNITSVHVDVRYEDLLQTQFEGVQTMDVLDGLVKVNVNLLIYLVNKK
ncbi:hypothetical protein EC973_003178 [Apophysomyces ossiformis]|uniref:Ras GTPase-activating-like protein IQGAP1 n=1 Tax=Apophysomyces ossiformis TaxID=679940 RepID=A0A8H7BFV9_9FUNG|nr:hypothetical protein EC973_003178 [Apophysomyces ossiformis]